MILIDQQEALDALNEYFCRISKLKRRGLNKGEKAISLDVAGAIQSLPTKVICCKDCKYWKEKTLYTYCEKMYRMGILDVLDYATEENDFCSMAEKRGGEDDETDCVYERAVEQLNHDMLYEPTFNKDDGSM